MRALSLRQPWAELVMRGEKTVEYRSRATTIRGRIYIYASLGRENKAEEAALSKEFGVDMAALPRGVIVGTVDLYDCDEDEWLLREPQRANELRRPDRQPMPVWFRPFQDEVDAE